MRLEDRVSRGRIVYIARMVHDTEQRTLEFHLATDPEQPNVVRVLRFFQVENFRQVWDDESDPDLLETIIGLWQDGKSDNPRYLIRLCESEIVFHTRVELSIEEVLGESLQ